MFCYNVITLWTMAFLAHQDYRGAGLNYYGVVFANALTHIIPSLTHGLAYNPGLINSVFFFLPACFFTYRACLRAGLATRQGVVRGIIVGFVTHVILFGSFVVSGRGFMGQDLTSFVQILLILPVWMVTSPS